MSSPYTHPAGTAGGGSGVLLLGRTEVAALLPMAACIELMAEALGDLARGRAHQPLRSVFRPPAAGGVLGLMPAWRAADPATAAAGAFGLKAITVFPRNVARGLDAHQGAVCLFDGETGRLTALIDASPVTALRTAAVSALTTRLLARDGAGVLALVGAGVEAKSHLEALACVCPLRRVRVASRSGDSARRFVAAEQPRYPFAIEAAASVEEAVRGADVVVTVTSAKEPVLRHEWLAPGTHVNAVGSCIPSAREIDAETMAAAAIFVDRRDAALAEAGNLVLAGIGESGIRAELGEVLIGKAPGRTSADQLTLFESLGLAVEDLYCAERLVAKATAAGAGRRVEL